MFIENLQQELPPVKMMVTFWATPRPKDLWFILAEQKLKIK